MPRSSKTNLPIIAVDLGGTKILTALISDKGEILVRDYSLTLAEEGPPQAVIGRVFAAVDRILVQRKMTTAQLGGIGLAIAGVIDMNKGVITKSPNLPGWYDVPLQSIVAEKYGGNTYLINDAKGAALGEYRLGAGKGTKNLIFVTVSTGIGGGIIIDGKLYFGASGGAGEVGHMTIDVNGPKCACGNVGCLEMLASGTAVAREAISRIHRGEKSILTEMIKGKIETITAKKVSESAQQGDALAKEVIAQAMTYLGIGMVNLVNIFNPETIVIGGGLSKMGNLLFDPVRQMVKDRAFPLMVQAVSIVPAKLGDDAGVLGAAIFVFDEEK